MAQDCFDNKSFGLANGFPQFMRSIMKTTETLANSLESDQARNFDKVLKYLNFSCNTWKMPFKEINIKSADKHREISLSMQSWYTCVLT